MALLGTQADYQMRHSNKEPEWSAICNNVFDEYLDTHDLFGFETNQRGRSSSDDSCNLFDFSGSSEQSHQTDCTSPIPSWEPVSQYTPLEAQQPKAKAPVEFWKKKLRALEQNAAESEKCEQTLRSTKSHPDLLSLGGYPSPPAIPSSPTDQSFSAQRRVSRATANGNKSRNITARSLSRGRPSGVVKSTVAGSVNPYATVRKCSASPPKMMNPSRYRAGFRDVWADKAQTSPKRYELRVPPPGLPDSPPPSARASQQIEFAAFGFPNLYPNLSTYDEQLSPLVNTFQQAHIHTPLESLAVNALAHASNLNFQPVLPERSDSFLSQTAPLDDTAPLYPERTSSLAANNIQAFDFGFLNGEDGDNWGVVPERTSTTYAMDQFASQDPFGPLVANVLPSTEPTDPNIAGLGISCDPALVSNYAPYADNSILPAMTYHPRTSAIPSNDQSLQSSRVPRTVHRSKSSRRSQSPSPPPMETRSRKASSRRASRHRRTKSTNSTPRQPHGLDKSGFVNFTPQDSNKILSGVAPSGSSKTKARREKEALDKRRRLSQAAVKAVVEAGGDLDTLSKAGLLGDE